MIYLGDSSVAWQTKGETTVKMVAFMKQMGFAVHKFRTRKNGQLTTDNGLKALLRVEGPIVLPTF